ncbi:sulfatase [Streptomyces sp. NPDC005151]
MADAPLRLLPWMSPEGRPCYLSTDKPDSRLSGLADEVEGDQLDCGEAVVAGAEAVLADQAAGELAVRFALTRAIESLREVLRVAESRGARIPDGFCAIDEETFDLAGSATDEVVRAAVADG